MKEIVLLRPADGEGDLIETEILRVVGFTATTMVMESRQLDGSYKRFAIEHPLLTLERIERDGLRYE